jgi:hypothetical protein
VLTPRAGELKGIPIVDTKFFRTRDTILVVGLGAGHPIPRIQSGVVRPAKIEVGLPVRDKINIFPAETINEGVLPQEEVVLPLAGLLVCVTSQLAPACPTSQVQKHEASVLFSSKDMEIPPKNMRGDLFTMTPPSRWWKEGEAALLRPGSSNARATRKQ